MNLTWRTDERALDINERIKLPSYHHAVHLVYNLYIWPRFLKLSSRSTNTRPARSTPPTTPTCGSIFTLVGDWRGWWSPLWCPPSSSSPSPTSLSSCLMSLSPSGLPFVSSCFWTCEPFSYPLPPPQNFALRSTLMSSYRGQMPPLSYLTYLDYCLIVNLGLISVVTLVVVGSAVHFFFATIDITTWLRDLNSLSSVSESGERAHQWGRQTGAGKYATCFKTMVSYFFPQS